MSKYWVYMSATASLSIKVDVDDTDLGPEEIQDKAIELAYEQSPGSICANCSGWREDWSREIGEWEPLDKEFGPAVEKVES
jgi:hypothetical protein